MEEALRWLPEAEHSAEPEILPTEELLPVPCPPLDRGDEKRPFVLVADDNSDMRQYLLRLLSERYEVIAVPDGQVALALVHDRAPDLILSDVMMPNLDGFGLLRELRSDPKTRTVPIILLSARAGEESRVEGMEHGADDYLIKPFSARELLARVQTHLEMARIRKQSEDALREHRERFELVAQAAHVGFWFCDLPFSHLEWDSRVKDHFWLPADANVTIETFYERLHPDDRERTRQTMAECIANDMPYDIEYRTVSPDGREKWIRAKGRAFHDAEGKPKSFDGLTLDITDRKKAETALRETAETLRIAQKTARSGTWDSNLVTKQLVVSPELEELWGLAPGTVSAQGEKSLRDRLDPEDLIRIDRTLAQAIEKHDGEFHGEFRITRTDGALRWIETFTQIFYDGNNKAVRLIGVSMDITERKEMHESERRMAAEAVSANAKFRAIFEQTPVFAGIMSVDGTLIDANQLCLDACGYKKEEVLGRPFWETAWWQRSLEAKEKVRTATLRAAQGTPFRETLNYHWADGTERIVDFGLHPIIDEAGRILFLHPTGVDITDLKRAEESSRRLAETLEAEVRLRTEELETRNVEVLRQSDLLRQFSQRLLRAQDEERRHIARELHDSAGQTLAVLSMSVDNLLHKVKPKAPDLLADTEVIRETVRQLHREIRTTSYLLHPPLLDETGLSSALNWYAQGLVERSGLEISVDISEGLGRLPREMELVVFRLVQESLTNIHRHSGSKNAAIRVVREDGRVTVEIRDQGKGMSPSRLAEIQAKGSGVGIRGMRERLRPFEGVMNIESDASGTRILVTIPLPKQASPGEPKGIEPLQAVL